MKCQSLSPISVFCLLFSFLALNFNTSTGKGRVRVSTTVESMSVYFYNITAQIGGDWVVLLTSKVPYNLIGTQSGR